MPLEEICNNNSEINFTVTSGLFGMLHRTICNRTVLPKMQIKIDDEILKLINCMASFCNVALFGIDFLFFMANYMYISRMQCVSNAKTCVYSNDNIMCSTKR